MIKVNGPMIQQESRLQQKTLQNNNQRNNNLNKAMKPKLQNL